MKIKAFSFGSMTVESIVYRKDLIVFSDTVKPNWRRKDGHSLSAEDLKEVIDYNPKILVVGKGAFGAMKIPESTKEALKAKNIKLIDKNTAEAYKIFNEHVEKGEHVAGAFHLTC